ncbi:hypothetical protein Dester_0869 [Desulfurobacterium thermolithotrophum DSM 11699]|uniref:Outer membrane protein beta-barrel domain-containing protein n=1 Tax=Desulfurobacterium thermolithotrophum (strain DSM 11699 / BSA) TaxID=868864 RepID=F0S3T7_DESTD|nr:hypothetical protein [Desulfurobacterium thermolithotrophum]ADY73509.1 hypothetical protein Dester_0869 [Desulfurobacterium thermolithotrophum DSM 11699]
MRKLLLACSLLAFGSLGANAQELKVTGYEALYGSYINYSGSGIKDYGYATTGYLSIGDGIENNVQLGAGYTHIKYKDKSTLNQRDFTAVYSNTNGILKNHTFTFGGHYINSDDKLTDGGYTLFFDGTYFQTENQYPYAFSWNAGVGIYYSDYNKTTDFYVFQLTPHSTVKLFSDFQKGALYLDTTGYYIHVSKSKKIGIGSSNYYSLDAALRYYYGNYDFKVGGWIGEQIFAVKNGGFVVYNLTEKYKGGVYGGVGYTFSNGLRLALDFSINDYKEVSVNKDVTQTVGTISLGYRF